MKGEKSGLRDGATAGDRVLRVETARRDQDGMVSVRARSVRGRPDPRDKAVDPDAGKARVKVTGRAVDRIGNDARHRCLCRT
jgi:hypothetical protein